MKTLENMLIKYDLLSVEALDKIYNCINLLCDYGFAERKSTLRETYESIVGIYNLERNDPKMWEMIWNHKITSLFQMEKQSGIQGIALTHPKSVDELAVLNSVIRLMAPERGAKQPLDMWGEYRQNINLWYQEMQDYGLSEEEINWLAHHPAIHNGIAESQESLMQLLQEPLLGGHDLSFCDTARKAIAKKQGKLFEECEKKYFEVAEEKHLSSKLVHYVWDVILKVQRGYSFCAAHTHAYSLVALQEMNLAYRYPIIFWNCACLICDSGGNESEEVEEDEDNEPEENCWDEVSPVVSFVEAEEDDDDDDDEDSKATKKKKKTRTVNYGKIATAIGKMAKEGIKVELPDINKSTYTFSPDPEVNIIRYGLNGIVKVGEEVVKSILSARPYKSIEDFLAKVKVTKPQMINLIKAGAFDSFGEREELMHTYVNLISDAKKRITLQNMTMLINFGLIPEEYDFQRRVFNFNKYLKKSKFESYYLLDDIALGFIDKNFTLDVLKITDKSESGYMIPQADWDKIYQAQMDIMRSFIKSHNAELLAAVNNQLTKDVWDKYCEGNLSKWEMDSVSFYSHEHELMHVNTKRYDFVDFFKLPEQPPIDRVINIKGKQIPMFKIQRIAGTVLDKNKDKKLVTLLTTTGVVTVKIYGGVFNYYDKQISERGVDGKKHVIEKSIFTRGNKIIISGIRQDDFFLAKKYKSTPWHLVEQITEVRADGIIKTYCRQDEE